MGVGMNRGARRIRRMVGVASLIVSLCALPVEVLALTEPAPQASRSLSNLRVKGTRYLFEDCNAVDWCWQPKGTYTNSSKSGTITYLEVVYTISARGESLKFVEKLRTSLRPGRSVGILSGRNNKSFVLSFYDSAGSTIGPLLGSTYVTWTYDVRYLKFSDGSAVGKRVNN
jgi:hypothetical protein